MPDLAGTVMDPSVNEHQMVIVTNEGPRPLRLLFHGQPYTLVPDVPQPIPYLAMVLWFGNPKTYDASDTDMERRYRTQERDRLASKWATGNDKWYADPELEPAPPESGSFYKGMDPTEPYVEREIMGRRQYMHPKLPRVKVETWDHQRIVTVIDDPFGIHSGGRDPGQADTKLVIEDLMRQLEVNRQNQLLMLQAIRDQNPAAADQAAANLAVRPDVVTSDTGLPVWPTTPEHPSLVLPDGSPADTVKAGSAAALGDDNGLTDSIQADPVPTKRVQRPTRN